MNRTHGRAPRLLLLVLLSYSGCGNDPLPGPDAAIADLAARSDGGAADLAAGADAAIADLAVSSDGGDLATTADAADLAAPVDAPPVDAALDAAPADLATRDLLLPDLARSDAPPDLPMVLDGGVDLAVNPDKAVGDLSDGGLVVDAARPVDLAGDLAAPCRGGYLNTDAGDGCPLKCSPNVEPVEEEGAFHVNYCDRVTYKHNPPASGLHWPWHPEWGIHEGVPQREWWVHALEHGGIVILYNCPPAKGDGGVKDGGLGAYACDGGAPPAPDSCPNEIAQLAMLFNERKPDNVGVVRVIVAPDPLLPKKFGAVAWNWSYVDDKLDMVALRCFIAARYGRGPEDAP